MADAPGSAAYGTGNAAIGGLVSIDQRGLSRLNTQGLDLGAYEYQTVSPYRPSPPSPTQAPAGIVNLLFLAEDQFALSVDSAMSVVNKDPAYAQVADSLMATLNSQFNLDNPALHTGLNGLQSAIYANAYFGTPEGNMAQNIGFDLAADVLASVSHS